MTILSDASITAAPSALRSGPTAAMVAPSMSTSARWKLPTFLSRVRTMPPLIRVLSAIRYPLFHHASAVNPQVDAGNASVLQQEHGGMCHIVDGHEPAEGSARP